MFMTIGKNQEVETRVSKPSCIPPVGSREVLSKGGGDGP